MDSKISVFPNPVKDVLNINLDILDFQKGRVVLYDILGKEVLQANLGSTTETIATSGLNKGVYFATILITTNLQTLSVTKKIIKE